MNCFLKLQLKDNAPIWKITNTIIFKREASKKHVEFAGRRNLGEVAKLYIKMESTVKEEMM